MAERIEGKRAVVEALRAQVPLTEVLLSDAAPKDGLVQDILRKARRQDVKVSFVPRRRLDELSERGNHQGVVALARPYAYCGAGDVAARAQADFEAHGRALVVVCDHLTDAGNLGAVIRSANAVGAAGVVIPNKRSARVEPSTYKSSAGAVSHVPVAQVANVVRALERLKGEGFWVCAATEHASELAWEANLKGKIALVLGNESEGVSRLVLEHCDLFARLPMEGQVASLNVAQAATALMYEWLRQNVAPAGR